MALSQVQCGKKNTEVQKKIEEGVYIPFVDKIYPLSDIKEAHLRIEKRKNLGKVIEAYQDVARRLGILHEQSNIRPLRFPKPKAVKLKKNK